MDRQEILRCAQDDSALGKELLRLAALAQDDRVISVRNDRNAVGALIERPRTVREAGPYRAGGVRGPMWASAPTGMKRPKDLAGSAGDPSLRSG